MEQTFPEFIAKERDRLKTERETIFNQQQELDTKLADINRELAAIDAYEAAKSGKQASPARTRAVARPATGRRSGIRDRVFEVVRDAPNGIAAADVRTALGFTDKSGSQSVANALSGLKRTGKITTTSTGAYRAAS